MSPSGIALPCREALFSPQAGGPGSGEAHMSHACGMTGDRERPSAAPRWSRGAVAIAAAIGLLFQLTLWGAGHRHDIFAAPSEAEAISALLGAPIELCQHDGSGADQGAPADKGAAHGDDCPLCQAQHFAGAGLLPEASDITPQRYAAIAEIGPSRDLPPRVHRLSTTAQQRAPPLSV